MIRLSATGVSLLNIVRGCMIAAAVATTNPLVAADLPRETARLIEEGNRFFEQGEFAKALDAFDRAAARSPESAEIAFNRGVTMYRLGDFDKAQTAFQDALRPERPDFEARAKYNLARTAHAAALSKPDDPQAAVKDLGRAIDFYQDALALKADTDARHNLDLARRMQLFLQKQLEQMKKEQQKQSDSNESSTQPSEDQKSPSSQPSSEQSEPSSQPQDQQSQGQEQQNDQQSGESSQSDQGEQDGDAPGSESAEESETEDGEQDKGDLNGSEEFASDGQMQNEPEDAKTAEQNESEFTEGQPEQAPSPTTQPSDSTDQKEAATTMPATSQPAGKFDAREISKQHALRLLDEIRQSERKRRELLKARALQRRGRIPVEKDW